MAYTSGTATSFHDLLDKLRLYLVAEGWTELDWSGAAGSLAGSQDLWIRGPGAGPDQRVYLHIQSLSTPGSSLYWWDMRGSAGYDASIVVPGTQLGEMEYSAFCNFWDGSIPYWFFVNDRRVVIVAKCSTTYVSAYLGFFLPFGTPDQYPFPLYIGGNSDRAEIYTTLTSANRMFADPGAEDGNSASCWIRDYAGVWRPMGNHERTFNVDDVRGNSAGYGYVWPYSCLAHNGVNGTAADSWLPGYNGASGGTQEKLVATAQGERAIMPTQLIISGQQPCGALDGVWWTAGQGLAAETVDTIGATEYQLFPNLSRVSGNDFFAMERVA